MLAELQAETVQRHGETTELRLVIDPALDVLPDHFPGHPMLPGVVQLGWAVRAAQHQLGMDTPLSKVDNLKFMHPMQPGDALTLRLEQRDHATVAFVYLGDSGVYSSGRLHFAAAHP